MRFLVALDFSECSRLALTTALHIAGRMAPTDMVVMTVVPSRSEDEALGDIERAVDELRKMVGAVKGEGGLPEGVHLRYEAVVGGAAEQIAARAADHHVDAIVIGTHGRVGIDRLILGSVAERVVRIAPCSVLTVKSQRS